MGSRCACDGWHASLAVVGVLRGHERVGRACAAWQRSTGRAPAAPSPGASASVMVRGGGDRFGRSVCPCHCCLCPCLSSPHALALHRWPDFSRGLMPDRCWGTPLSRHIAGCAVAQVRARPSFVKYGSTEQPQYLNSPTIRSKI
jgi:hypothetical protein